MLESILFNDGRWGVSRQSIAESNRWTVLYLSQTAAYSKMGLPPTEHFVRGAVQPDESSCSDSADLRPPYSASFQAISSDGRS